MPPTPLPITTTPQESTSSPVSALAAFAQAHRLKVKRDDDGEPIVPGKLGNIYEHDTERLGLLFMPPERPGRDRRWSCARRRLGAAGFEIWQDGDFKGSALFHPTNEAQARLAVKVVGIKRKRRQAGRGKPLTPERARELARIRAGNAVGGAIDGQKAPVPEGEA